MVSTLVRVCDRLSSNPTLSLNKSPGRNTALGRFLFGKLFHWPSKQKIFLSKNLDGDTTLEDFLSMVKKERADKVDIIYTKKDTCAGIVFFSTAVATEKIRLELTNVIYEACYKDQVVWGMEDAIKEAIKLVKRILNFGLKVTINGHSFTVDELEQSLKTHRDIKLLNLTNIKPTTDTVH